MDPFPFSWSVDTDTGTYILVGKGERMVSQQPSANAVIAWYKGKRLKVGPSWGYNAGLILGLRPANERRCYFVTTSLIGWAQTYNQPCAIRAVFAFFCVFFCAANLGACFSTKTPFPGIRIPLIIGGRETVLSLEWKFLILVRRGSPGTTLKLRHSLRFVLHNFLDDNNVVWSGKLHALWLIRCNWNGYVW